MISGILSKIDLACLPRAASLSSQRRRQRELLKLFPAGKLLFREDWNLADNDAEYKAPDKIVLLIAGEHIEMAHVFGGRPLSIFVEF